MNKIVTVFCVCVISIIDLALTTFLYCHGYKLHETFSHIVSTYSFTSSVFELWILCVARASVILGLVIGIIKGKEIGIGRIRSSRTVSVYFAGALAMFTLIKLLSVSENAQVLDSVWFWTLFAWTLFSSIVFVMQWCLLGNTSVIYPPVIRINCDGDLGEKESLLGAKRDENTPDKDNDKTKSTGRSTILRLLAFSRPDWFIVVIGFIFLTLSATGEIFIPFYTGRVVDGIVIDKSEKEFTNAIIIMALISTVSALAAGVRGGCFSIACDRFNIRVRQALFMSVMKQEVGFFDTIQTGEITSRLTSDTTTMSDTLGLNVNVFLRSLIKSAGVLFFMLKLSWRLTLITFVGLPCMLAVSKLYGQYYKKLSEEVQDSLASANNVAEEACSTVRTVRSFANETGEVERYAHKLAVTYQLNKKQAVMYSGFVWSNMLFELALTVSVLYYGGHLVLSGTLTGGTLISFILYQIQLGDCVDNMGYVYTGLMQAAGASEKVFDYIDRKPKISYHGSLAPDHIQGRIEFKDVCFSYPSRPDVQVLKNISFTVNPGEVIALVGPSGGGKSSCVNLLEYFYTAESGQVLLDNIPIQEYDHHYLHKQISMVGQEPILYARSVEENIRYGLHTEEWTDASVEAAAEMANAHKFISELKDGYQTQTGEKGVQMSGGQKQRIAIARALLRQPRVLLLDEATSALDSESEYLVQQALYNNLNGRTVIVIAHRLSTVEKADRIIVIDKGQVLEQGTHGQLLTNKGTYANLVKRQLLITDSVWTESSSDTLGGELLTAHKCTCVGRRKMPSRQEITLSGRRVNSVMPEEDICSRDRAMFIVGSV